MERRKETSDQEEFEQTYREEKHNIDGMDNLHRPEEEGVW